MIGALADPPDGGVLAFRAESAEVVEEFARNDPYMRNGVATGWRVRRWMVVLGDGDNPP